MKKFYAVFMLALSFLLVGCGSGEDAPEEVTTPVAVQNPQIEQAHQALLEAYNTQFPEDQCDAQFPEGIASTEKLSVFTVEEGMEVYRALCSVHAYQVSYIFFLSQAGAEAQLMSFDTLVEGEREAIYRLITAFYNQEKGQLISASKARGLGDCGTLARYTWDGDEDRFDLYQFEEKVDCDGDIQSPWPVVYDRDETGQE